MEFKIGRFDPAYVGQLGAYVVVVDDRLRRGTGTPRPSGSCFCKSRNDTLVRYAPPAAPAPLVVADYTYDTLPGGERATLPSAEELAAALEQEADASRSPRTGDRPG